MNGKYYTLQNAEVFKMVADLWGINPYLIGKLDRARRTVTLCNGTVYHLPDHWNLA